MYLYHGTLGAKRYRFDAFSHFGTYQAAVERIARRVIDGHTGRPLVLKIPFRLGSNRVLHVAEDWGSNQPISLACALKNHFETAEPEKYEIFEGIRGRLVRAKYAGEDFLTQGWTELNSELDKLGIEAIAYPNRVEDRGSTSYCVVKKTRRICIGHHVPSVNDLEQASKAVRETWQPAF